MKIYLLGHDYKYAVEQMLLTLWPLEHPEYPVDTPEGERMEVSLSKTVSNTTAFCSLHIGGGIFRGRAGVSNELLSDKLVTERYHQQLIKQAIYRAYLATGAKRPAWGALTGVRPGKLLSPLLREGMPEREALKRFERVYDVSHQRAELCLATSEVTLKVERETGEDDVCLYIGIPFCPTRCTYCSFVSQSVGKSMKLIPQFLEALYKELHSTAEQVNKLGLRVISIYMGGGTPTTLTAQQFDELCAYVAVEFDLSALREYTVEAGRPDTITMEKLRTLRSHGVDRVSVNPQTMSDAVLEAIGRKHSAADIITALDMVRTVGGLAVNMDLIAGLPADTPMGFRSTVDKVLALSPENITVHTLSLKKGSQILLEKSRIPTADEVGEMLDFAGGRLRAEGYQPYYLYRQKFMSGGFENVGWTKEGYINLYNVCIMEELCSIIACGGGGSTKLIRRDDGRNIRLVAPKYPQEYIDYIDSTCGEKEKIKEFYSDIRRKDNGI